MPLSMNLSLTDDECQWLERKLKKLRHESLFGAGTADDRENSEAIIAKMTRSRTPASPSREWVRERAAARAHLQSLRHGT